MGKEGGRTYAPILGSNPAVFAGVLLANSQKSPYTQSETPFMWRQEGPLDCHEPTVAGVAYVQNYMIIAAPVR